MEVLCQALGLAFTNAVPPERVAMDLFARFRDTFLATNALPVFGGEIAVVVVHARPWEPSVTRRLRQELRMDVRVVGAPLSEIERSLGIVDGHLYPNFKADADAAREVRRKQMARADTFSPWKNVTADGSALIEEILERAYLLKASDVHITFERSVCNVLFRMHGELESMAPLTLPEGKKALDGVKSLARLRLSDEESFLDGKAEVQVGDREEPLELRVAIQKTPHGQSFVVRLLDADFVRQNSAVPFREPYKKLVLESMQRSSGLFLVTGPTGSGKSTTLYRCLLSIDRNRRSVKTIENPIEYTIPGVVHTQTGGYNADNTPQNFSAILRSLLRADPDVILVGEIRDRETATIALEAANTGHLILSTLHTTDALGAITRLIDLGGDAVILEQNLLGIVAQRLVPRLCPSCKVPVVPTVDLREHLGMYALDAPERVFERNGCSRCNGHGFGGRLPIFEFYFPDHETRPMIKTVASQGDEALRSKWRERFRSLARDGLDFVVSGEVQYQFVRQFETNLPIYSSLG